MSTELLNQDQRDALQEVTNIAMGQAGSSLAQLLGVFVYLSVPRITVVEVANINKAITAMVGEGVIASAVRQSFHGAIRGEALTIFDDNGYDDLADLMGYEGDLSASNQHELLLDVANLLIGACLTGIGNLLETSMSFSAPSMMVEHKPVEDLLQADQLTWQYALLVEVNFALEGRQFTCHLTQLMPESSISTMQQALDKFMESF